MKRWLIIFIATAFCQGTAQAQHLKVVNATKRSWSGGVAGHYGENYAIILKPLTGGLILDSVYINNIGTKLVQENNGNVRADNVHHTYTIYAEELHDDNNNPSPGYKEPPPSQVRHFTGAALVLYTYKGKAYLLIVKNMQSLPPIDYP